jgi:hypothetical protein
MNWQLAAIWIVVGITIAWFIWDERRLRAAKLDRQARYFAHAPQYRYVSSVAAPVSQPPMRVGGLRRSDHAFFNAFLTRGAER